MGGRSIVATVGSVAGMVRSTRPTAALLDEGIGAEAADALRRDREVALLGRSNSAACLSFMIARASCDRVLAGQRLRR